MPSMYRPPYGEPDVIADESFNHGLHCIDCYWYESCIDASRDDPCDGYEECEFEGDYYESVQDE